MTIPAGQTSAKITVLVRGDTDSEPDETFFVNLRSASAATIADGRAQATILNDDSPPTISVGDATVFEGNGPFNFINFNVTLSAPSGLPVEFRFRTVGNSATPDEDFGAMDSPAFVGPGLTFISIFVPVYGDTLVEGNETFFLDISEPTGATVADGRGVGVIRNDDSPTGPATLQFDRRVRTVSESATSVTVTVTRSGNASQAAAVDYATHVDDYPGAASDRGDYTAALGTLRFAAGETSKSFDVLLNDDARAESQEFITVVLSNAAGGASLGEPSQTGYRVFRLYRATFPDSTARPRGMPKMPEFLRDAQEIGRNVIVGAPGWEDVVRQNVTDFARRWVTRPEVLVQLPVSLSAAEYVDKLFANSGVTPTTQERDEAIAAYGAGGTDGRAAALSNVTNSGSVFNKQYDPAFVYMQYAGYLRRHPSDAPDTDFTGFDFWLGKLDSFTPPGDDVRDELVALRRIQQAEMVKAFITSIEYRQRFGTP